MQRTVLASALVVLALASAAYAAKDLQHGGRQLLVTTASPGHTLAQAGPACIELFMNNTGPSSAYATDVQCANYIQLLMAAQAADQCPDQAAVKACINKSPATLDVWTSYVSQCEVFNIEQRGPGFGVDTTSPFQCWDQVFADPQAWRQYAADLAGNGATRASTASALLAAAAAAALAVLIL